MKEKIITPIEFDKAGENKEKEQKNKNLLLFKEHRQY
jgi:hypothetical protein